MATQPDPAPDLCSRLFELTQRSVVVCDQHRRIVWVNPSFTRLTGYTLEEAVGRNPGRLLQGARTDQTTVARLHAALTEGRAMQCELLNYRKDGSHYWNDLEIMPLRDADGTVSGYISLQEEITLERRRIAALARHAPGLICQFHIAPTGPPRLLAFDENQALHFYGFTSDQLAQDFTPCLERILSDERKEVLAAIEESARKGTPFCAEHTYAHPDGTLRRYLIRSSPERLPDGGTLWHGYVDDLTEQHAHRERLSLVAAQVPGVVYQFEQSANGQFQIPWASPGSTKLFGYSPTALRNDPAVLFSNIIAEDRGAVLASIAESARSLKPFQAEYRYQHPNGSIIWITASSLPHEQKDGSIRWHGFAADATERKRTESELRQALHAAEQATASKSAFLATMSHEIRTPMNGVLGMLDLLRSSPLGGEQFEQAEIAYASAQSLMRILDDVLDIAKLEAGRMELDSKPFDLAACVHSCAALFRPRALANQIDLRTIIAPGTWRVIGDAGRVRQILLNLLSNAVKFTKAGAISINLAPTAQGCRIQVNDTGIGITPAVLPQLFAPFTQADSSLTRQHGGTGLGLAICRQLAELMGGSISVQSQPDCGSSFTLHLPWQMLPDQPTPLIPARPPSHEALRPLRVLVVEDELINRIVARDMLSKLGCTVELAPDGESALLRLARDELDVVFMDVQMTGIDGRETTRLWRQREANEQRQHLTIIALTAYAMPEDRAACLASGMDSFLTKPVTMAAFREVLGQIVPRPARSVSGASGA